MDKQRTGKDGRPALRIVVKKRIKTAIVVIG